MDVVKEKFKEFIMKGKHGLLSVKEQWFYENDVVYSYDKIYDEFFKGEAYVGIYETIGSFIERYYINIVYITFLKNIYLFNFTTSVYNFGYKFPFFFISKIRYPLKFYKYYYYLKINFIYLYINK